MLVPIEAVSTESRRHILHCRNVAFIAQLIATAEQAPQTRKVRRANAADAMSVYDTTKPANPGKTLSKVA